MILPASPTGLVLATPIPFPTVTPPSGSNAGHPSRASSRSGSLFSVSITPASYDSRASSPLASPISSSPEEKQSGMRPAPQIGLTNPLLAQVLHRRLGRGRAQSLHGAPTAGLTPCPSQSMGSFAPPDCAELQKTLQSSSVQQSNGTRKRTQSHAVTSGAKPDRKPKSSTLPSAGIASQSLRALATLDTNRPRQITRPPLPWAKRLSLWSVADEADEQRPTASAPPTPGGGASRRKSSFDVRDTASVRHACTEMGGPLPPLDPALARQERNSRLLEARECATCGAHGGSFPQCAKGCGTSWCSRECRMENRKMHQLVCKTISKGHCRAGTVA